jgi:hypothetical protein
MIPKSVRRFSLATNAGRVCAEIMLNQKLRSAMVIQPDPIALWAPIGCGEGQIAGPDLPDVRHLRANAP